MSLMYCEYCEMQIDTDYYAEHFDSEKYWCIQEEEDLKPNPQEDE